MADLVLKCGRIVQLSEEDFAWATNIAWRSWRRTPGQEPWVVSDETSPVTGRKFRRRLLREVAVRVYPDLAKMADRVRVMPANGDYFDARRENLEIRVRPMRRGRPPRDPRPTGYVCKKTPRRKRPTNGRDSTPSPLWNAGY